MRKKLNRVVVDGVMDAADGMRWWQEPEIHETERTHRGLFRRVLLMLI
ncbi:MAG: hypothetical protein QGH42_12475 [Kiritimatiellia bacterium]|jgi:hypothetical protein|nr:hypothetical protein [Kiritimatiellia bacterium]MDP6809950.1 hypothetical protein [Kiritimatiellia bacterium]MDP7025040.1 hypothetical protein [Kiritimatiellia bacterium]